MEELRNKNVLRYAENKQKMAEILPISNQFKYKQIKLSSQKRLAEQMKTHGPTICYLQENHFRSKDKNKLEVKSW